jgi:AcrR family transcriptional regulator
MEETDIRNKILRGAEGLFMKYGVRSISMDDIARHLSVSKKTLYQHFEDKEDIVTITCQMHIQQVCTEFELIRDSAKNAIDELAKISGCLKQQTEEMNPSLLFDLQKYHPRAWSTWIDHKNNFIRDSIIRNLKQGVDEGYFRSEIDQEIIATMRLELVQLAFDDKLFPASRFKLADVQLQIFDHFVYGLVTDKGRKLYQKYRQSQLELSNQ